MKNGYLPFFQLIGAFLIWSSWVIPVRLLNLNPITISFVICLWASFFWGIRLFLISNSLFYLNRKQLYLLVSLAIFFVLNMLTYLGALRYTTAAVAVLTHYTAPVFVAILAPIFLKEKLTARILAGLILSLLGFVFIFYNRENIGGDYVKGALLGLASGLFYGVIIIIAKKTLLRAREEVLLFYQNIFSSLIIFTLIPFVNFDINLRHFLILGGLAFLYSLIASELYMRSLKLIEGIRVSIIGYFEPLGTIIWGFIFFKESITIKTIIGGLLILFSGYLVTAKE